jgi:hypothetical protein
MTEVNQSKPKKNLLGISRFSVAYFLVTLIIMIVVMPFAERLEYGNFLESLLLTLVLVSAVLAVGHRRRVLLWAAILVSPAIVCKWLFHFWQEPVLWRIYLAGGLIFIGFIISQLLRFILRAPRVDLEVLCAGISTYLMLGLWWASAYALVAFQNAGAFVFNVAADSTHGMEGFTTIYFSLVTLSTVGYGDITPASDVARMLAAAEAMTGTLFVAVLISRLVSIYSSQPAPTGGK